jgi:Ca-activated chloride channel family protein
MGLLRPGLLIVLLGAALVGPALRGDAPPVATGAAGETGAASEDAVGGTVRVRIVEPAPPALILGETRITAEASAPAGAAIARVEIHIDGRLLSVLERPPFTLTFDAGSRFATRTIRVVAVDTLGRRASAEVTARPLLVGQYEEVRLVSVHVTVRDRRGGAILDLARGDFTLFEDGVPQPLTHFAPARLPLAVALLLDASNSMNQGGKIDLARRGAEAFIESVGAEDRLLVLHFNDTLHGATGAAAGRRQAKEAIAAITAGGGTALYDALHRTAGLLAGLEGRRVLVLLSDGRDQAFETDEPGSLRLFEEALQEAHRQDVAVYAIGLGHHLETELELQGSRSLKEILDTLARETGGRSWYPDRPGRLAGIYQQVAADLKHQYTLGYVPANRVRDGAWRRIEVRVAREGARVQARSGYYAPAP